MGELLAVEYLWILHVELVEGVGARWERVHARWHGIVLRMHSLSKMLAIQGKVVLIYHLLLLRAAIPVKIIELILHIVDINGIGLLLVFGRLVELGCLEVGLDALVGVDSVAEVLGVCSAAGVDIRGKPPSSRRRVVVLKHSRIRVLVLPRELLNDATGGACLRHLLHHLIVHNLHVLLLVRRGEPRRARLFLERVVQLGTVQGRIDLVFIDVLLFRAFFIGIIGGDLDFGTIVVDSGLEC